jgi:hypothetical protein
MLGGVAGAPEQSGPLCRSLFLVFEPSNAAWSIVERVNIPQIDSRLQ